MNARVGLTRGFAVALAIAATVAVAQSSRDPVANAVDERDAVSDTEMSNISGELTSPRRHFRLRGAEAPRAEKAQAIYDLAIRALAPGYARSNMPAARDYTGWRRFNRTPYLSATHGNHLVNNYANPAAAHRYGEQTAAEPMPIGAVLAKDSFGVTRTRGILLGPLFLMEKMPRGFSPALGNWKYSVVLPDGAVLGETGGIGSERVEYCVPCHLGVKQKDYLFYVPEDVRDE